jgi:hypothetical protein
MVEQRSRQIIIISVIITLAIVISITAASVFLIKNYSATSYVSGYNNQKKDIRIMFVGDLMFDRGIRYYAQKNGGNEFIFDKIDPTLASNDLVVANLEGSITNEKSVSAGTVPGSPNNYFFTFDPSVAETLFNENIKLVNLGNNHILNFGQKG